MDGKGRYRDTSAALKSEVDAITSTNTMQAKYGQIECTFIVGVSSANICVTG
jgi:hypothetical protein